MFVVVGYVFIYYTYISGKYLDMRLECQISEVSLLKQNGIGYIYQNILLESKSTTECILFITLEF